MGDSAEAQARGLRRISLRSSTNKRSSKPSVWLPFAALFLFCCGAACAAEIHGVVKNAEGGEPLSKIQVTIAESNLRVETAKDGKFQFNGVPPGNYTLRVSGVGYRGVAQSFSLFPPDDSKEFEIFLVPDFFRRNEVVEVHGDVFEPRDWPAVGDFNLTSSELQQSSTVAVNDPYRSLQSLPGVSASSNNDLQAQFSVMGAPYEDVGVYVDDVRVPNLLHTIPGFPDAASLSLFTGNDVDELRLLPVAYPVRYAEDAGAALEITTRTGTEGPPAFHFSAGLVDVEGLAEGGFSRSHHSTWLISARKSYTGYLDQFIDGNSFSDVGIYDANLKVTYDPTPAHMLSLFATGGQTHVSNPSIPITDPPDTFKGGNNDLAIGRLGWRWQISPHILLDTRVAYVRSGYEQDNPTGVILQSSLDREWSTGTILSWNWRKGGTLETGYSIRWPHINDTFNVFDLGETPVSISDKFRLHSQNAFFQFSQDFWNSRVRVQGGVRWAEEAPFRVGPFREERVQPVTGQASAFFRILHNTQIEAGWGKYAEFLLSGGCNNLVTGQLFCAAAAPYESTQYLVAIEQLIGDRARLRIEGFDRENQSRSDFYIQQTSSALGTNLLTGRDYSRGMQILLQRRSENRLSGWIGYTLVFADQKSVAVSFPGLPFPLSSNSPYQSTLVDQRHSVNLFASYRLTPTIRLGVKNLYGSGYPVIPGNFSAYRLGTYERLDLRIDKSWQFSKWKLGLYGELLNTTSHYNPIFSGFNVGPTGMVLGLLSSQGVPITPTVGIAFDF